MIYQLYMTVYGNISDIDMSVEELKAIDISKGDYEERGFRLGKIHRDIKLRFSTSY